ncbi:putative E3 ubiquitin-protein ligase RHY1A [Drosera capensis]
MPKTLSDCMTSASLLLCGRKSRPSRAAASDAGASARAFHSSRGSAGGGAGGGADSGNRRQRNSRHGSSSHHHHRQAVGENEDGRGGSASHRLWACAGSDLSGDCMSLHIDGALQEFPSASVINTGIIRNNNSESNRLPRAVMLARERVLQRLGVPVSGIRQSRVEVSTGSPRSEVRLVAAGDWETSISTVSLPGSTSLIESFVEAHSHPLMHEGEKKPPGLTVNSFTLLQHEVYSGVEPSNDLPQSTQLNDCSICLESFVEGNSLSTLPCNHRFHSSCLYPWVEICGECPYCRAAINPSKR